MHSPVTCPDCGVRRDFVGFENKKKWQDEIRIFHCSTCDLTEKLKIAGRKAISIARSRGETEQEG